MLVRGRGGVAVASCDCNTKLRKVREGFVRVVVSKHGLLTAVGILQLLWWQDVVVAALLPPEPRERWVRSSSVSPVHKPPALCRLLLSPVTSSPGTALGASARRCKAARVGDVKLALFPR